jgi:hypothetical protein
VTVPAPTGPERSGASSAVVAGGPAGAQARDASDRPATALDGAGEGSWRDGRGDAAAPHPSGSADGRASPSWEPQSRKSNSEPAERRWSQMLVLVAVLGVALAGWLWYRSQRRRHARQTVLQRVKRVGPEVERLVEPLVHRTEDLGQLVAHRLAEVTEPARDRATALGAAAADTVRAARVRGVRSAAVARGALHTDSAAAA